jgi:membrane protein YqaA with SNARE-associated domain
MELGAEEIEQEGGTTPGMVGGGIKVGPIRRLYDWVLAWADRPSGPWALFGLSAAESSFFPIPPDPLLIALCLGAAKKAFRFAAIATVASVVGGLIGYAIGAGLWQVMDDFFYTYVPSVTPEAFERVRGLYDRYDFWAVFLAGLTPIPYKVFTLSSGVFGINLIVFTVASFLSRGLRFVLVAALIYRFGPPVKSFIDRHFNTLIWVFSTLLVLGFVVIEFVI